MNKAYLNFLETSTNQTDQTNQSKPKFIKLCGLFNSNYKVYELLLNKLRYIELYYLDCSIEIAQFDELRF